SFHNNLSVREKDSSFSIAKHPWTQGRYEAKRQCSCYETIVPPLPGQQVEYRYHYTGDEIAGACPCVPPDVLVPICAMSNGDPFVPGDDADILVGTANNVFDVPNPTSICPDPSQTCSSGDFGVGDFDGDGVDDLFLGTGAGWWFSAGGKTEWRFLNR